jgi:hypothetical protein
LGQHHLETAPKKRMIIDDEHPDRLVASSTTRDLPRKVHGHVVMMTRNAPFGSPIRAISPPEGTTTTTDVG